MGGVPTGLGLGRITVGIDEAGPAGADPADAVGRAARDKGMVRDVPGDHRPRSDHREPANLDAGHEDRPGTDRRAVTHDDR